MSLTVSPSVPRTPPGKSPTVGGRGFLHYAQMLNPRNSMSITNTKGLLNMPGQNNCFLNSAVQVLWHLDIFRRSFRELSGHACMEESCIFCALKELFAQFQYSQESALPPDALRRALAETFCDQRRFQLGFMDDAAECFENILMRIHFHIANSESEDMCSANHCIPHQKFAMTLVEQTVCHSCGATSEPLPFTQMVHYVPSSALCSQAKLMKEKNDEIPGFSELLRRAGGLGDLRDCPSSCGAVIQIRKTLMNRPEIVSIGLVWDSERPTIEHIMDVFKTIGMSLKLQDVFHSVVDSRWASTATHQLVGIVTYYGKHYSTFFFHTKLRVWIYFDDAAVREIGPKWEQVVEKCCRGHFQPLLLLYANPHGSPVNTSTAPRAVTGVPGHKKNLNAKEAYSMHLSPEKKCRNFQLPSLINQRRAVTPNPEVSCDLNANVQPRRAVTPSGELSWCDDNKEQCKKTETCLPQKNDFKNMSESVKAESCIQQCHASCCVQQKSNISQLGPDSGISILQGKAKLTSTRVCVPNSACYKESTHTELSRSPTKCSLLNRPASVDDILQSSSNENNKSVHCTNRNSCMLNNPTIPDDNSTTESTYISRKAVENVLHLQKLQRQKSLTSKHGHVYVAQRNSSSSLESLDNVFVLRDKGVLGLKLDIPDAANVARRRDSGNWSGDRNSASSSSTTSLDNPYFYVVGNKRPLNGTRSCGRLGVPETGSLTDAGYDSFSLSSSDSYPSAITNSSGKLDSRLGQIPEHMQTAFVPYDLSQLQYCLKDLKSHENFLFGFKDECDKLCAEADIFVAKSVERENAGDISMAALLSDTAAAKARAAMDIPYSNNQALAMAKMKHSMCLIRSSNLHKKLKEAEAALRRIQKEETSRNLQLPSNDKNSDSDNKDRSHKAKEENKKDHEDGKNSEKSIEIYATLPKKNFKKKGALSSFVDSLTGDDSSDEKEDKSDSKKPDEKGVTGKSDSLTCKVTCSSPTGKDEKVSKSPGSKKKSRSASKVTCKDSDLSDYSSEWETTKKPALYRTYSGPPSNRKGEYGDMGYNSGNSQTFSEHPTKKQHKIRRKLMGGFMRRKNRSLPDLREGQDSGNEATASYDDSFFTQTPVSCRKQRDQHSNTNHSSVCQQNSDKAIPISPDAIKNSKHIISRSQTPPPYKPPPPIACSNNLYNISPKKSLNFEDAQKVSPIPLPLPSRSSTSPRNDTTVNKAHSMHHRQLCRDSRSTKSKPNVNYSNGYGELPRNSAVWLKELQMKQEELNQRRKLQEEREKWLHEYNAGLDKKYGCTKESNDKSSSLRMQNRPNANLKNDQSPVRKAAESATDNGSINQGSNNPKSVRDLTSKFEKISHTPTQAANVCGETSSAQQQGKYCDTSSGVSESNVSSHDSIPSNDLRLETKLQKTVAQKTSASPKDSLGHHSPLSRNFNPNQVIDAQSIKYCGPSMAASYCMTNNERIGSAKQQYSSHSTSGCVYNPHLTDAQLTNVLRIGTNRTSFRNSSAPMLDIPDGSMYSGHRHSQELFLYPESKRPDKPPDYETAIQRLELFRNDRNFAKFYSNSNCINFEAILEQAKRRRGPKKSVTFSDKVVLVACAGDEDNDFIPNPLLERVYKQHLLQMSPSEVPSMNNSSDSNHSSNSFTKENTILSPNTNHTSPNTNHVTSPNTTHVTSVNTSTVTPSTNTLTPPNTNSCSSTSSVTFPNTNNAPNTNAVTSPNTNAVTSAITNSPSQEGGKQQGVLNMQSPCHLCHKKTVESQNLYCPDCAYYMSRFQQK